MRRSLVRALRWLGSRCIRARLARGLLAVAVVALAAGCALDALFPLPRPGRDAPYAQVVLARDGQPLRAFPDRAFVWRQAITLDQVSPRYVEALIRYEDRYFYWHPGINPIALARALGQWAVNGHIVSGASTLTMQVARLIDPTPHTAAGKLRQMLRALQLEMHYSKREILTLYLNFAPMGGVLEGVESASRGYFGKPASALSPSEAALLAVLPQKPSRWRPDRFPENARLARDKVLGRMAGAWDAQVIADAREEGVIATQVRDPLLAPLLAERVKRDSPGAARVETTIDARIQAAVEALLLDRVHQLPPHVSMAALVLDNRSAEVLAYAGSADFNDDDRFSFVDMVRARRSPGSTLKPFLYGFALDDGLVHSESLLSDVPQAFAGYEPANFQQTFHGAVSVSEALVKSLNVPAVEVLSALGPRPFVARLEAGGLRIVLPRGASPNLSVILGGAAVTLENMTGAYAALARGGMAVEPRLRPEAPLTEHRMMSAGAAYIVRDILATGGSLGETLGGRGGRGVAWKTGTSFGFRDAWAFGVTERYTIGVWVGRPDGTPNPGFFGANVAAPLLLGLFDAIPDSRSGTPEARPATVTQARICWPDGRRAEVNAAMGALACPIQRTAWILDGAAPPTLPDPMRGGALALDYWRDPVSGLRVLPDCAHSGALEVHTVRWPVLLEPWIDARLLEAARAPRWASACATHADQDVRLHIFGARDGEVIEQLDRNSGVPLKLEARGAQGHVYWIVNGHLTAREASVAAASIGLREAGGYDITALDDAGHYDRIHLRVRPAG